MKKLNQNWLTDGILDFEYKQYVLLAYLKFVKESFRANKLYPPLGELIFHYNNLINIKNKRALMSQNMPKELKKIDLKKLELQYERIAKDSDIMRELTDIINYALPLLKDKIEQGTEIYDFVEDQLELDTVGLIPIYDKEGYMFIETDSTYQLNMFKYHITAFDAESGNYRGINTEYVGKEQRSITNTYHNIKLKLTKRYQELPNPATFLISAKFKFPILETVLPIAKRMVLREVKFQ